MCGIAGIALTSLRGTTRGPEDVASDMVEALGHRGPDGRGVRVMEFDRPDSTRITVALGHTRLAILDLSDRGGQPMGCPNAPIWITFNGEIYNFKAIRVDLERAGHQFRTGTDTEVILRGFQQWGIAVVERLQGMFAFAIWDGRSGELFLVRDRLGIKPLYFVRSHGMLLFASEVRALLASGLVSRRVDPVAVDQYLSYQTVPPPRTLVEGVRLVEPGHIIHVGPDDGTWVERRYWDMLGNASRDAAEASPADARREVTRLLEEAASLHLVSDVPVGLFLSGGIDSSALVALTKQAGVTPRTFTVVLPGSALDEAEFARTIARRFDAHHTEITLDEPELRRLAPEALGRVDHPSADGFNTYVVAGAVRRADIKVALSGLGGDELFGGYPSFRRLRRAAAYGRVWRHSPQALRHVAAVGVRTLGRESVAASKAAAVIEGDGSLPRTFPLMRQLFSAADRTALLGTTRPGDADPYVQLLTAAAAAYPQAGLMSQVSYAEARTYMHDVLLRDTDQMTMAHGLEARVPLLDHRLVEYVMGLPDERKEPGATPKRLLVESLGDRLPAECVYRPKQGFVLPFDRWMRSELRSFCEHHLGPAGLAGRGMFRPSAVSALWQAFSEGSPRTTWSRPWALVALDSWIECNRLTT